MHKIRAIDCSQITIQVIACAIGLLIPISLLAEESFPKAGIITTRDGKPIYLSLREGYPKATAFSYTLAPKIGIVASGTRFTAHEVRPIINGEIWYRVTIETKRIINRRKVLPDEKTTCWMIGKFKTFTAVSFTKGAIATPTISVPSDTTLKPGTTDTIVVTDTLFVQPDTLTVASTADTIAVSETQSFSVSPFLMLIFGTMVAVIVAGVERARNLSIKAWFSHLLLFEFVIVGVANILILLLLIGSVLDFFQSRASENQISQMASLFYNIATGSLAGSFVAGFALSIWLLKYISFANHTPNTTTKS